jgi:hypothetical protein
LGIPAQEQLPCSSRERAITDRADVEPDATLKKDARHPTKTAGRDRETVIRGPAPHEKSSRRDDYFAKFACAVTLGTPRERE